MAREKMNMAAVASKVGGMAAGVVAGGVVSRYLNGAGVTPLWSQLGMIVAGTYLPKFSNEKGAGVLSAMGDALIVKGVNGFLTSKFPNFIAGAEDELSGPYDDSVSGYPTSDEVIVSGPGYDNSDKVSGFTN